MTRMYGNSVPRLSLDVHINKLYIFSEIIDLTFMAFTQEQDVPTMCYQCLYSSIILFVHSIREFNTLIEDWEPEDDDKDHLPVQASANLMAINGELFAIVQGDDVYRYKDGEDPAWELVRSNVKFASKRNYVYSMLYHKFV